MLQMDVDALALLKQLGIPAIAGVLGFIGGIFTEPMKKRIMNRDDRRRLRNSLYSELGLNLSNLVFYLLAMSPAREKPGRFPPVAEWVKREVYDRSGP